MDARIVDGRKIARVTDDGKLKVLFIEQNKYAKGVTI